MPGQTIKYIVSCKSAADIEPAKKLAEQQGGKIGHIFNVVSFGFEVDMPADSVTTLSESPHIDAVERDGGASIQ